MRGSARSRASASSSLTSPPSGVSALGARERAAQGLERARRAGARRRFVHGQALHARQLAGQRRAPRRRVGAIDETGQRRLDAGLIAGLRRAQQPGQLGGGMVGRGDGRLSIAHRRVGPTRQTVVEDPPALDPQVGDAPRAPRVGAEGPAADRGFVGRRQLVPRPPLGQQPAQRRQRRHERRVARQRLAVRRQRPLAVTQRGPTQLSRLVQQRRRARRVGQPCLGQVEIDLGRRLEPRRLERRQRHRSGSGDRSRTECTLRRGLPVGRDLYRQVVVVSGSS